MVGTHDAAKYRDLSVSGGTVFPDRHSTQDVPRASLTDTAALRPLSKLAMYLSETVIDESSRNDRTPTLKDTARLFGGPLSIRSLSLTGLFILACFYTLYFASAVLFPVTLALVLMFLFAPLIRALQRGRIPSAVGSAMVIVFILGISSFLVFELSSPLAELLEKAPETGAKLQSRAQPLRRFFDRIASTGERVEKLTQTTAETKKEAQAVELKKTNLLDTVFSGTQKPYSASCWSLCCSTFFSLPAIFS